MDRLDAVLTMGSNPGCWSVHRLYSGLDLRVRDDGVRCDLDDGGVGISFRPHRCRFGAMACDMLHPEPYPIHQTKSYKLWPFLEKVSKIFRILQTKTFTHITHTTVRKCRAGCCCAFLFRFLFCTLCLSLAHLFIYVFFFYRFLSLPLFSPCINQFSVFYRIAL